MKETRVAKFVVGEPRVIVRNTYLVWAREIHNGKRGNMFLANGKSIG